MKSRIQFFATTVAAILLAHTAQAVPVDYTIFDADTLENLGTLTVDPDLASPAGSSNVALSALSLTENLGVFGDVTITLGDYTSGTMPYAQFEDGVLQALSANTGFDVGGLVVGLDITPQGPTLDFVGVLQMLADPLGENEIGPVRGIGISLATVKPVPEPLSSVLLVAGLFAIVLSRRGRVLRK